MTQFSVSTIVKLKYYVYALINPLTSKIFYIGKGSGNRVFEHEKNLELGTILELSKQQLIPKKVIIDYNLDERTARIIESNLIITLLNQEYFLDNIQKSKDFVYKFIDVNQIENYLRNKPIDIKKFNAKVLCINLNNRVNKNEIKNQDFVVEITKKYSNFIYERELPNIAISIWNGVVIGAFEIKAILELRTILKPKIMIKAKLVNIVPLDHIEEYLYLNATHIFSENSNKSNRIL